MANPAEDLRDHIATALALTAGTDVFAGDVLPADDVGVKDKAIFVRSTGGPRQMTMGAAADDVNQPSVQVMVRGHRDDQKDTSDFATSALNAVHKASVLIGAGPATYEAVLVSESKPTQLTGDGVDHPMFSFNATMWHTGP